MEENSIGTTIIQPLVSLNLSSREGKRKIVKLPNMFRFDQSESDCAVCYPMSHRLSVRERSQRTDDSTLRNGKGICLGPEGRSKVS